MQEEIWDVIIIGAGPAGLSAAVNAKARNLRGVVVDARDPVAKVRTYPEVTNYLGLPKLSGNELAEHFVRHFAQTGFPFRKERVLKVVPMDSLFMVSTEKGVYQAKSVILTLGVAQSKVLPGEEQYLGRGVSYCVTCDGALFRGKDVVVVGYIPEGEEEANALAGFARTVTYVATYEGVRMLDKAIDLVSATPIAIIGDSRAHALRTSDGDLRADGIFIVREALPAGILVDGMKIEEGGFIAVNSQMETNVPGILAAGDCTGGPFQIAKAVGQGQVAALSAARYVYMQKTKEG